LLGLFGRKYLRESSGLIGTLSLLGSALLSVFYCFTIIFFVTGKSKMGFYQPLGGASTKPGLNSSPGVNIDMGLLI